MKGWLERSLMTAPVYYRLCLTEKDFKRACKHLKVAKKDRPDFVSNWHSSATTHHFESQEDQRVSILVCMRGFKDKEDVAVYGLLVHEAVHIWQECKRLLGEHKPSAEFEAYSIQGITQQLMWSFKEQTK